MRAAPAIERQWELRAPAILQKATVGPGCFDCHFYKERNQDLNLAWMSCWDAFVHFINYGQFQLRAHRCGSLLACMHMLQAPPLSECGCAAAGRHPEFLFPGCYCQTRSQCRYPWSVCPSKSMGTALGQTRPVCETSGYNSIYILYIYIYIYVFCIHSIYMSSIYIYT